MLRPLLLLASALLITACGGSGSSDSSRKPLEGDIAPNCTEANCAEVDVSAALGCYDPIAEQSFSLTTRVSGRTHEVSCAGESNDEGGLDLMVGVRPQDGSDDDYSEAWFRLRGYNGPGAYPLFNRGDDGAHLGFELIGNTNRPAGNGNKHQAIGTNQCFPSPCEAVVAEGSDLLPNDPMSTHEFRVRVEVLCPAGGELPDMYCETDAATVCTFGAAPTLRFDLLCFN